MFGFTNDVEELNRVIKFREDAIADGWTCEPTYGKFESVDSASSLTKNGFTMLILTRTNKDRAKWKYEAEVSIWGTDKLAIEPPKVYDYDAIVKGLRVCGFCGAKDVATARVDFANRCCANCLYEARKRLETAGWCD